MSSEQDSICETRVQMDKYGPWSDLLKELLELVMLKLDFCDQMRVIAVCKDWCSSCKDLVSRLKHLPRMMRYYKTEGSNRFSSELIDPYTQRVTELSNIVESDDRHLFPYDSKDGWVLLSSEHSKLFLHNPFTNQIIHTDLDMRGGSLRAVTIDGSPLSPGCKIFTTEVQNERNLQINSYCMSSKSMKSTLVVDDELDGDFNMWDSWFHHKVLCMKGNLYCLFKLGRLYSYRVEDGEWKILTEGFTTVTYQSSWLVEMDGKLVLVCMDLKRQHHEWMIFWFDWTVMAWVPGTDLKNCEFFISGHVAWCAPLTNNYGKQVEACKLFHNHALDGVARCYTLTLEAGTGAMTKIRVERIKKGRYDWISSSSDYMFFIQPPYCMM